MTAEDAGNPKGDGSAPRVLVVDGDAQPVRLLANELRRWGCEPLEATTFEEAKRLWTAERPPLIVIDVCLGQFNGLQLLLRAKADRPDVKAVITCAFADKVLESETQRFGGTFLVKPFTPVQVATGLRLSPRPHSEISKLVPVERRVGERRQNMIMNFTPDRRLADRRRMRPVL